MTDSLAILLLVMAAAAFLCRVAGFTLMRLVPVSPRIEAALRAKGEQLAKLTPGQYARYMADRDNGLVLPLQVYITRSENDRS